MEEEEPEEFGLRIANQLEQRIEQLGVHQVAAFIAEPVQGAGGVVIPPETYWPRVVEIGRRYDVLLVADEVITGFGRMGEWFGCDYYGFVPDLMPFAKAVTSGYVPLGGVMVHDRVAEVLSASGEFAHGYTYSGHPVAAAVALANLDLMISEEIVQRVRERIGPYFQARWAELAEHRIVGECRSVGLLGALEIVPDKSSRQRFDAKGTAGLIARDAAIAQGLVMRAVGDTVIVAPPLVFTREHVDELVTKAARALDKTVAELAGAQAS